MGAKLGTLFVRKGHEVIFSCARSMTKLGKLAREAQGSARAGTPGEAAKNADAFLLAVHWSRVDDVLKQAPAICQEEPMGRRQADAAPVEIDDSVLVLAGEDDAVEEAVTPLLIDQADRRELMKPVSAVR